MEDYYKKSKPCVLGVKWQIRLSPGLVIGNKEWLLMVNVLVGQKLVAECPGLSPGAYTVCNIYKWNWECGNILKFADDTKLFCKVGSDINCAKLGADLRKLYKCSEDWQMLFNLNKCKIMHFGYNNPDNIFLLGGHILESVDEEKDLGVMIRKDLKASSQCVKIVKAANQICFQLRECSPLKQKINYFSYTNAWLDHTWNIVFRCGTPV